jgi:hypothetical protein
VQGPHLNCGKYSGSSRPQLTENYGPHSGAYQPLNGKVDGIKQSAYETVATFGHLDLDQQPFAYSIENPELGRGRHAVGQFHPTAKEPPDSSRKGPGHFGEIRLRHAMGRMRQAVGQIPVISEEKQSLGVGVEPAHVEESLGPVLQDVSHAGSSLRVAQRGEHPPRFVQGEIDAVRIRDDPHPIDVDYRGVGVHSRAQRIDDGAINGYSALADELFTGSTAPEPGRGEHALQPYICGHCLYLNFRLRLFQLQATRDQAGM